MSILRGLLQDEQFLVAAGLLSAGSQGQNIGQAAFPALLQAAQIQKAFTPEDKERKTIKGADGFQYYIDTGDRVLPNVVKAKKEEDQKIVKGNDGFNYYVGGEKDGQRVLPNVEKKPNKQTMGDAEVAVYNKLKVAKNDKEFKQILDGLSKAEQQLYYNKIAGDPDLIDQMIVEQFENQVKLDPAQMSAISEYKLTKKVEGYENVMAIVEAQIENNPDVPFDKILESLIEAGLIEK